ncbi:polysaccharide deacetylase family protein [Clostridium sp. C2-6-12]|uniref:polysaccharide deacetylase family protein n=1 Tax=Clostridium sp. C2-6-12 TaxID=2698832 RepID=UPI00136A474A|nr:polysaccharide deacetylase family protein [Clostridium sp. C2-6-12]
MFRRTRLFKRNLALYVILALFLSGCGGGKENQDSVQAVNSRNNIESNDSSSGKITEQQKSSDEKVKAESQTGKKTETDSSASVESNNKQKSEIKTKLNVPEKPSTPTMVSDISSLSTKAIEWSWLYSSRDSAELLKKYKGYGFGDTSQKIIYLTFDEGYENGYTESILNTLKANNVQAAFFVTKPYVTGSYNGVPDSELLKRMSNEGHIIANHSVNHKSMPKFTDENAFNAELIGVEEAVNNIPGCRMSKYFRPPEGTFSELSLYYTQKLGYKSVFFSLAYQDYNVDNQPDPGEAKSKLLKNTRNGMICLLHAVSKTNATILDSLIKEWKRQGYEFKTLDNLPS